jgi:hypothetical protein
MTENQQQTLMNIGNVLDVRADAIILAFEESNPALYTAAIDGNDEAIVTILDEMISEGQVKSAMHREAHEAGDQSLEELILGAFCLVKEAAAQEELVELRDLAQANVDLAASGELSDPPTLWPTTELIVRFQELKDELAETMAETMT